MYELTPEYAIEDDGCDYDIICDFCGDDMDSNDSMPFWGDEYFEYGHPGCGKALGKRPLQTVSTPLSDLIVPE